MKIICAVARKRGKKGAKSTKQITHKYMKVTGDKEMHQPLVRRKKLAQKMTNYRNVWNWNINFMHSLITVHLLERTRRTEKLDISCEFHTLLSIQINCISWKCSFLCRGKSSYFKKISFFLWIRISFSGENKYKRS